MGQEKEQVLKFFDNLESVGKVINKLAYPSRQNLYTWIKNRNVDISNQKKQGSLSLPSSRSLSFFRS